MLKNDEYFFQFSVFLPSSGLKMSLAKQQLETMGPVTPLQIVQEKVASMKALVRLDLASAVTVRTQALLKILLNIFQSAFFPLS